MSSENDDQAEGGICGSLNSMIIMVLLLSSGNIFGGDRRDKCGCGESCRCGGGDDDRLTRPFVQ